MALTYQSYGYNKNAEKKCVVPFAMRINSGTFACVFFCLCQIVS